MTSATGLVTAVIAGAVKPTVNVAAGGGPDGVPGVQIPGWYDPAVGDLVEIEDKLGTGVWRVTDCLNRRGLLQQVLPTIPRLLFGGPGDVPAGASDVASVKAVDDHSVMFVYSTSAPPPPPTGTAPVTVAALNSATWDPTNTWDSRSDEVRQGNYPGIGPATGCYFYPNLVAALSGQTVTGLSVHIGRASRGGSFGALPLQLALHNAAGPVGGQPGIVAGPQVGPALSVNAQADCPLPLSWAQALAAGTAAGVCITTGDYLICTGASAGSGALTFTVA